MESLSVLTWIFLSDFFDGYLARKLDQKSLIGAVLDPVADKLVALSLFGYFYWEGKVPGWYFSLILIRDIAQLMSVPILMIWKKITFRVEPKQIPKWGTALNFLILTLIAIPYLIPEFLHLSTENISWEFLLSLSDHAFFFFLLVISGSIEVYILVTYIPRFLEIYQGKSDVFE